MARTKVDIITCDRCGRTLEEAGVSAIECSILYDNPFENAKRTPTTYADGTRIPQTPPQPTKYTEVCKRCDTLLRKLAAQAAPPSKPGRKKEKEDD